jgi:hypothetical protein
MSSALPLAPWSPPRHLAAGASARRIGLAVIAFLAGGATALIALGVAFRTAPGVILADDMVSALVAAAERPLRRFPRGATVYVKSAVGPVLLETLRPRYPALSLRPYAARPAETRRALPASAMTSSSSKFSQPRRAVRYWWPSVPRGRSARCFWSAFSGTGVCSSSAGTQCEIRDHEAVAARSHSPTGGLH